MPRKSRTSTVEDTAQLRLEAAQKFAVGDRVCHRTTNKTGNFIGICDNVFALPEVWVSWDETENELQKTYSCNPLELELIDRRNTELQVWQESEPIAVGPPALQPQSEPTVLEPLGPQPQSEPELEVTTLVVCEELTDDELADRQRLEIKVERAFYEAGAALRELRDRRLYRSTHKTFKEYCYTRFGFTHRRINYLIAASQVVENIIMGTNGSQNGESEIGTNGSQAVVTQTEIGNCPAGSTQTGTIGSQTIPINERQVRPLTNLKPQEQREAWKQAVEQAGGKVPSGQVVNEVVRRLKQRDANPSPINCKQGDVFVISGSSGELRKYSGCWAIAMQINNYTISVQVHDGDLVVEPKNLRPVDSSSESEEVRAIARRLTRLRECGLLDRGAYYILEGLGRQTYLTPLEAKLLAVLEQEYGVE